MIPTIGLLIAVYCMTRLIQVPLEHRVGWEKKVLVLSAISLPAIVVIGFLAFALVSSGNSENPLANASATHSESERIVDTVAIAEAKATNLLTSTHTVVVECIPELKTSMATAKTITCGKTSMDEDFFRSMIDLTAHDLDDATPWKREDSGMMSRAFTTKPSGGQRTGIMVLRDESGRFGPRANVVIAMLPENQ